jgi:hypothetical protein
VSRLHGAEERVQRDDRLARADVALQQALHRLRIREILADLADRFLLLGRECEGEGCPIPLDEMALVRERGRIPLLGQRTPPLLEAELEREQLLEGEPLPGRLCLGPVARPVRR